MFDDESRNSKYPEHGYVTGSSITGFEMAIPLPSPLSRQVTFGGLVEARTGDEGVRVVGVVGNIVVPGDEMAVRLATRKAPVPPQALLDYQANVTAVEVKAYVIGYYIHDDEHGITSPFYTGYPHRPPFPLDQCYTLGMDFAQRLLKDPGYVSTMYSVSRPAVPIPYMIASHILWLHGQGLDYLASDVAARVGTHFKSDGDSLSLISTILGTGLQRKETSGNS